MAGLAVVLLPARAARVVDAELVRVEQERVAVGEVELLLVAQQPRPFLGEGLDEPFPDRACEDAVFFLRQQHLVPVRLL